MKTYTKTLAVSLSLLTSTQVVAGLGGLNVQSNLGEPFSGSIVVTGKEAEALLQGGKVNIIGGGISGTVQPQGNGKAVIRLRSGNVVNEPIVNFVVKAGNQTRQYSAMINPSHYSPKDATRTKQPSYVAESKARDGAKTGTADARVRSEVAKRPTTERAAPAMARGENAQYHRVQTGETLAQIAERYRPHNMSMQRAMRAIMAANPRAFRRGTNGNIMYDNSMLYIPTPAQFHNYANSGKRGVQRRITRERYQAPATTAVAPMLTPETNVASDVAPKPVAPTVPTPASAVESVAASPAAVSEVVAPVASIPAAASDVLAASSASAAASEPETASVPASVVVAPVPTPQPEPESGINWLPIAAGGLAVLGGLGYLLSRRRKAAESVGDAVVVHDTQHDDELLIEEVYKEKPVSPAVAAAHRVDLVKASDEHVVFNDEDDDVFGTVEEDYTPAEPMAQSVHSEFNLDTFEPENVEITPTTDQTDDLDWLNQENAGKAVAASGAVALSSEETAAEFEDDDSWLEAVFEQEQLPEAEVGMANVPTMDDMVVEEVETPDFATTQPESDFDDFELPNDEPVVLSGFPEVSETVSFDMPETESNALDFDVAETETFDSHFDDALEMTAQSAEDLSFDLDTSVEENAESAWSLSDDNFDNLEWTAPIESAEDFAATTVSEAELDMPVSDMTTNEANDLGLTELDDLNPVNESEIVDALTETEALADGDAFILEDAPADEQMLAQAEGEDLSWLDDVATPESDIVEPEMSAAATELQDMDWLETETATSQTTPAGFVSEAVGMTAPQEAKLELAKMYLEIDDAVAARETLRELIGESQGTVQQQAKDLLNELGG